MKVFSYEIDLAIIIIMTNNVITGVFSWLVGIFVYDCLVA